MFRNSFYWVPAFLYAALIFFVSHQSRPPGAEVVPAYTAHFFEYAFFALTLIWGATTGFRRPLTSRSAVLVVVITILYAISDEFHQSFIPERDASLGDVTADVLGGAACVGVVWFTRKGKWR